jgi:formate hydrogenlyase subunit 6/NADH:ubiquinone oxidoreductase subunit I
MEKELLRNVAKKPVTLLYPHEKVPPVEGMRTMVTWKIERCIGCNLCSQICPSEAIEVIGKEKDAEITYHLDRCIFCGECVDICPTKAIKSTTEYELAFTNRDEMLIDFKRSSNKSTPNEREFIGG